jgi:hypothetical protein
MDAPFAIAMQPGIVTNDSSYSSTGRYVDGNMVRSWQGRMQKWLGWGQFQTLDTDEEPARGGLVWNSNDGNGLLMLGTANKLWLYKAGVRYDVTPQDLPAGLVDSVSGSFGWGDLGYGEGPWGGGFGAVPGQEAFARVWTIQRWGQDAIANPRGGPIYVWTYGDGDTVGITATGDLHSSTTIDNLSNDLDLVGMRVTGSGIPDDTFVDSVNHGANSLVLTQAASATAAGVSLQFDMPAVALTDLVAASTADSLVPTAALAVLVTDDRELVAIGAAQDPVEYDALNIAWCDREDYLTWTPTALNTAGAIRCESGNQLMGVAKVFGGYLMLTDLSAHPFTFVGGDDIWSLDRIGSQSGCIAPLAMTEMDGVAYWMGFDAHYTYNGKVNKIPCDVHATVFQNLNRTQSYKIIAGTNRAYNEVLWFWTHLTETENNRAHAICLTDGTWSKHVGLARSTWIDANALFKTPLGCEADGDLKVMEHDSGTLADGEPFEYSLTTAQIQLNGQTITGDQYIRLKKIVPDFVTDTEHPNVFSGQHALTVYARGYPYEDPVTKGPYDITTQRTFQPKARGRTFQFELSGTGNLRVGNLMAYGAQDGAKQ